MSGIPGPFPSTRQPASPTHAPLIANPPRMSQPPRLGRLAERTLHSASSAGFLCHAQQAQEVAPVNPETEAVLMRFEKAGSPHVKLSDSLQRLNSFGQRSLATKLTTRIGTWTTKQVTLSFVPSKFSNRSEE